jgi:hypothetical protein
LRQGRPEGFADQAARAVAGDRVGEAAGGEDGDARWAGRLFAVAAAAVRDAPGEVAATALVENAVDISAAAEG